MNRIGLGLAAFAFVACFGGSTTELRHYALSGAYREPSLAGPAATTRTAWPVSMVVARFETKLVYERLELVYRPNARELRFDAYRLWVAKPGVMLSEAVAEHLRSAGIVASVTTRATSRPVDYELRGEVLAIEEVDIDATHWQAHLAMRFELVSLVDDAVVWRHAFAAIEAVPKPHPSELVATLDAILGTELTQLALGLDGYFAGVLKAAESQY